MNKQSTFSFGKKVAASLTLLFSLQTLLSADSRVEEYHNSKNLNASHAQMRGPSSLRATDNRHNFGHETRRHIYEQRQYAPHRVVPQSNMGMGFQEVRPALRPAVQSYARPVQRPVVHHRVVPHYVVPQHRRVGYHVTRLQRNAYHFRHSGLDYYYNGGVFYRPFASGFHVVLPPLGVIVTSLPVGYVSLNLGGGNYYRYDDIYYQWAPSYNGYRVVNNPYAGQVAYSYNLGDVVEVLPQGAAPVYIDDVQYYEYDNYYFRPHRRNGVNVYTVIQF